MGPSGICLVALLSLLIPAHSAPDPTLDTHWQLWVKTHQKSYKDTERARRTIWEETLKFITVHNLEYSLGLHTYEVGMNHLGDMVRTPTFYAKVPWFDGVPSLSEGTFFLSPARDTVYFFLNLSKQGKCGSCYAFSAVGALECQVKKKTGSLVTFSPQELVDCSYTEGNKGCKGGTLRSSFMYMKNSGILEDFNYPYTAKPWATKEYKIGLIKDFQRVPARDEMMLMKAVGTVGPVSVAINSSSAGFRMYKSGVFYDPSCISTTNHNVLVVGYGTEQGMDYWLVKNRGNYILVGIKYRYCFIIITEKRESFNH
uniref:Uncharacterized protein n=1 Tax=Xenopus tropicalis TaxID=8364 RepID=A0A6I8SLE1_XENTR